MSNINKWKYLHKCNINGYTLVIPSVAVGNVGQLACDLVISSLNLTKLALIYSPALIPLAGNDPYRSGSTTIASASELYLSETKKIIILLLRAPLVHKYAKQFLIEIVEKFRAENIRDIVILTSSFAHEKKHIMTSNFRYIVNEWCPYKHKLINMDCVEHQYDNDRVTILGGGFASLLYGITTEKEVPCLIIYKYVSEGDNIPDAREMVQYLNIVLPLFEESDLHLKLIYPASWSLMFGGPPPKHIY